MDETQSRVESLAGFSSRAWLIVVLIALYTVAVLGVFSTTVNSMIEIWSTSETFTHGFLIAPISIWLVWRERYGLSSLPVQPQPGALILIVGGGIAWLVAHQVSVSVVQHLALVFIFITGLWSIVGSALAARMAFPLAFLFLAVPMGESLIPPLMEFTADTLELMVRASGIPVYREGTNLSLPTGNWSVVEACSGVRYLIASFTLGLLYAHLTYYKFWHKVAFVFASILVPIIANSLRAYGIVMIGHFSDMKLAVGVDHLLYGWVFFGLVMILMFWVGSFWGEERPNDHSLEVSPECTEAVSQIRPVVYCLATVCAIFVSGIGPVAAWSLAGDRETVSSGPLVPLEPAAGWELVQDPGWDWQPKQPGADREMDVYYSRAGQPIGLLLRQHLRQTEGGDLVSGRQTWRANRKEWKVAGEQSASAKLHEDITVDEAILASHTNRLLVWAWYSIDQTNTASPYMAKLLEAKQRILNERSDGARVFVATPVGEDVAAGRAVLQEFLSRHHAAITVTLDPNSSEQVPHE